MVKGILYEKDELKETNVENIDNLFKICNFRKDENFEQVLVYNYKNYFIKLFGRVS